MTFLRYRHYTSFSLVLSLLCQGLGHTGGVETLSDEFVQFKTEIIKEINKQRLAYSHDLKLLQQQRASILSDVQGYSNVMSDHTSEVLALKRRISELENKNADMMKLFRGKFGKLEQLMKEISSQNEQAYKHVIREVTAELTKIERKVFSDGISAESHQLYKVVAGDTLGSIAKAFGVSLKMLKAINQLENDLILVDQELKIPDEK